MKGKEIKDWRTSAGMTQSQLAERLGVTSNTVARWERDEVAAPVFIDLALKSTKREPFPDYLARLLRQQGLSVGDVSKRSGLSISYLHELRAGKKSPKNMTIDTVTALARGLGRSPSEVFEVMSGSRMPAERDPDLESIEINLSRLPPAQRAQARFLIQMLSREIQRLLKE